MTSFLCLACKKLRYIIWKILVDLGQDDSLGQIAVPTYLHVFVQYILSQQHWGVICRLKSLLGNDSFKR